MLERDNFDEKTIKRMALAFCKETYSDRMEAAAKVLKSNVIDLEDFFIENPDLEDKLEAEINAYSNKTAHRSIRAGVGEAIKKLNELISFGDEDEQNAYKSANALLNVWAKIETTNTKSKKGDEEDDPFAAIEKEINESISKENSENNK